MTQSTFKFKSGTNYPTTVYDLLDHTVGNPCGDWSVTDLTYTPDTEPNVVIDNHGFLTVTAAGDLPDTGTTGV